MQLGIIGYPLEHSRSPEIFTGFFEKEGLYNATYKLFQLEDIGTLRNWLKTQAGLNGFNVTIPHKKSIIPFLDVISDEAKAIGSVNTVKIIRQNGNTLLHGYNTDYFGFKTTLQSFLGDSLPKKALILGTGGTANTVAYTLGQMGIEWVKVSRQSGADALITYDDISEHTLKSYHLIVNTTPLGMYPAIKTFPAIPYEALSAQHFLYDLVYNPVDTFFLQKGREHGAHTHNGLAMLKLQAQKAWEIWKMA
jgi:shikimate dehydrogenase